MTLPQTLLKSLHPSFGIASNVGTATQNSVVGLTITLQSGRVYPVAAPPAQEVISISQELSRH